MQQVQTTPPGQVKKGLDGVTHREMISLCTHGSVGVNTKRLEESDFCQCICSDRPCNHARDIYPALDANATTLYCKLHRRPVAIEEAMVCLHQT